MDGVGTPIIGRPRPLRNQDTPNAAHNTYTLKCEEPLYSRLFNFLVALLIVGAHFRRGS